MVPTATTRPPAARAWLTTGARARHGEPFRLGRLTAQLALLPAGRAPTPADCRRISGDWRARLDEQIAAVEALRDRLDGCIACGCVSLEGCSLYNPGDALAAQGPAPDACPPACVVPSRRAASPTPSVTRDSLRDDETEAKDTRGHPSAYEHQR